MPVGTVHSVIKLKDDMPVQGVTADIEVFMEYVDAMEGIEDYSHLFILSWLHEADRDVLKATPRKISPELPEKGIFSMRSPSRPNPIALTPVTLLGRSGRFLHVSNMDVIDGTPVLDIKPYHAGWDCIFSARNPDKTEKIKKMMPKDLKESFKREAFNYHGELCIGLAVAVRMAMVANQALETDLRVENVGIVIGKNPCISDSLIGITGARLGTHRLLYNLNPKITMANDSYSIFNDKKTIIFKLKRFMKDFFGVLECDANDLFNIEVI
ncbi:tRNA (N6-threonylcarbamoyladenosine(37)-N6)-methyltransferase TrmO [Methanooceanicella nereidis]|uniref:tRNA (N6-threonylcarbamoyladenosine(37)-N6)-methyltransferase TrmO n=1 Tax=Methanooceanicella nereidis TaxID=2052831 RepID=UPI0034E1E53C